MKYVVRIVAVFWMMMMFSCKEEAPTQPEKMGLARPEVARLASSVIGVGSAKGVVQRRSAPNAPWEPLHKGDAISLGDELSVSPGGAALVEMKGGTKVSCRDNTSLAFVSEDRISITSGALWIEDRVFKKHTGFGIDAPRGKILTARGVTVVERSQNGLMVSVISGTAKIEGKGEPQSVAPGQEAFLGDDGAVSLRPVKNTEALVAWTRQLRQESDAKKADPIRAAFQPPEGLGSLTAKAPGTRAPLPFHILSQKVDVTILDNIAKTTIEQVFQNPTSQVVEATYKFPIPGGATLTQYDMEIKGKLMKGEIVERDKGRRIMNKIIKEHLDRLRDPALVEWESGSTFKTRIFPIQPKEKKRIVLSYLQPLHGVSGDYLYTLPTQPAGAASPQIPEFAFTAKIAGGQSSPELDIPLFSADISKDDNGLIVNYQAKPFAPKNDFTIRIRHPSVPEARLATFSDATPVKKPALLPLPDTSGALAPGGQRGYFLMALKPELPLLPSVEAGSDWVLLVDTSLSRTPLDAAVQNSLVDSIIGAMGYGDRFRLFAYDWNARAMAGDWQIPDDNTREGAISFLNSQGAAGATNMAAALRAVADVTDTKRNTRILLIGDGSATLGETGPHALKQMALRLFAEPRVSVNAITVGADADTIALREITTACRGRVLPVSTGEDLLGAAVRIVTSLRKRVLLNPKLTFSDPTVSEVFPSHLQPLANGEEIVATGRLGKASELTARLEGTLGGAPWSKSYRFKVEPDRGVNGFIPRIWATHKIDALTVASTPEATGEIIALSKKHGVPSRHTSLIVLENNAMYREFKVAQTGDRPDWNPDDGPVYQMADADAEEIDEEDEAPTLHIGGGGGDTPSSAPVSSMASGKASRSASMGAAAPSKRKRASAKVDVAKKEAAQDPLHELSESMAPPPSFTPAPRPKPKRIPLPPRSCRPGYTYDVQIWKRPLSESPARLERLKKLTEGVAASPLSRNARRKHLGYLVRLGRYDEGVDFAKKWLSIDRTDPDALRYLGNLERLTGRFDASVRTLSGILDVQPENKKVIAYLANLLESRGLYNASYPFRTTLSALQPDDPELKAKRALAAARAERRDEAAWTLLTLAMALSDGTVQLKPGIKLPSPLKESVLELAEKGHLSAKQLGDPGDAATAPFSMKLTWQGNADLDLFVTRGRNRVFGGEDDTLHLLSSTSGTIGEILYGNRSEPGGYAVSVTCASNQGCAGIKGTLKVRVNKKSQTLPFTLSKKTGQELARTKIERFRRNCYREVYY